MAALIPVAGVPLAGNTPGVDDSVTILTDHATLIDANTTAVAALNAHGAANHTNLTRSFWMPAGAGSVTDDANLVSASAGPVYAFPDAGTETVTVSFAVPENWASGFSYVIYWVPATTVGGSTAVRWSSTYLYAAVGADFTAAGTADPFTGANTTHTANLVYAENSRNITTGLAADTVLRFALSRLGGNANDTYTDDAQLIGVKFSYTANQ